MTPSSSKKGNPVSSQDKDIFADAQSWENSITEQLEKSERRAWNVAKGAGALALLATTALVLAMPLKKSIPFLYTVDKVSGETQLITPANDKQLLSSELNDKHWLKSYVESRENYNYRLLQRDYDTTLIMSTEEAGREYARRFAGEDAMDKKLGPGTEYKVKVVSVRLPQDEPGKAVVSYEKTIYGPQNPNPIPQRYISTISYQYSTSQKATEKVWIENPFGFQVTAYRTDPEINETVK